jgi:hypothetical protein
MSISQPSHEIYVIDIPEIKQFTALYNYNFFVPDESVNATGGVPANILARPGSEINSDFIQYSVTRAPRFVQFSWTIPHIADVGNQVTEQSLRDAAFKTTGAQNGSLILDNVTKIVNEDSFANNNYTSINFHDGQIDDKVHTLVSGTLLLQTMQQENDGNNSSYKSAQRLIPLLPSAVQPHFVLQAMTSPGQAYGAQFYVPPATSEAKGPKPGFAAASNSSRVTSDYFQRLKRVKINTQINNKFISDLVNRTMTDPTAPSAGDLVNMHQYSSQAQHATNARFSPAVSESDYKSFVPFISVMQYGTNSHAQKYGAEIVGYVIDKFEILTDGTTQACSPIVVDSPSAATTADFQVKFNANYCYCARTIAQITMPAINDDDGTVAIVKFLVSSKPSNNVYVSTLKLDAPPPPGDINFIWNYEVDPDTSEPIGLMVVWAFPVTSERDIKQFQVFRRENTQTCFELQKVYDFDDSVVPFPSAENPDPSLVEVLNSPAAYWRDDDFDSTVNTSEKKGLIYSVCAIDAHGLTSNYSAQYRVWFDPFQNKLQKKLVSHAGAPKPYPNLYLEGDLFVNTIQVQGPNSTHMRLYFNPEYYYLYDDRNRYTRVLQTVQTGGSYKLQFLNVDNLKTQDLDITIDDQTMITSNPISSPTVTFGKQRKPQKSNS